MTSAPYPNLANPTLGDVVSQARGHFVKFPPNDDDGKIRGLIPSWYLDHTDPGGTQVRCDGALLLAECDKQPFTVDEVPVERRWAIGSDGNLMSRSDFRDFYLRLEDEIVMALKADSPDTKAEAPVVPGTEIPDPAQWVSVEPDPHKPWKFLPMHYNPDTTRGAKPKQLGISGGDAEDDVSRMDALLAAYNDPKARQALKAHEVEEVELHIRSSGASQSGLMATVALLTEQLAEDAITQDYYNRKLRELSCVHLEPEDQGTRVSPPQTEAKRFTTAAPCGREFHTKTEHGGNGAIRSHRRACSACREIDSRPEEDSGE